MYRKTRCVVDITSHGTPPKRQRLRNGTALEVGTVEKKLKDVKNYGITRIHLVGTPSGSGSMLDSTALMSILEKEELIERTRKNLESEIVAERQTQRKLTLNVMAEKYAFRTFLDVQTRRLFQSWLDSKAGKLAHQKATIALNKMYQAEGLGVVGDFVSTSKCLLRSRQREHRQSSDSIKVSMVRNILETVFMPGLNADGYFQILDMYLAANIAVHQEFSAEELSAIQEEAEDKWPTPCSQYIKAFTSDIMKEIK